MAESRTASRSLPREKGRASGGPVLVTGPPRLSEPIVLREESSVNALRDESAEVILVLRDLGRPEWEQHLGELSIGVVLVFVEGSELRARGWGIERRLQEGLVAGVLIVADVVGPEREQSLTGGDSAWVGLSDAGAQSAISHPLHGFAKVQEVKTRLKTSGAEAELIVRVIPALAFKED